MGALTWTGRSSVRLLVFGVVWVWCWAGAIQAGAQSPRSPDPRPLNVLFITVDDLNNDLGCYGHDLAHSPHIDRLAAGGVRFDRAYCQYPVCNPSRSSFMTGLYPDQTGVLSNAGDFREKVPDVETLPQMFQRHGYTAARVGKIYHYGVPNQIGTPGEDDAASWDLTVNPRGIDREVHDRIHTLQPGRFGGTLSWLRIESEDSEHTDGIGASAAIEFMETHHPRRTGKPFFLAVGFYRPHTPYVAPGHYFDLYPLDRIDPVMERPGDRDDIPVAALADRPGQRELTIDQRKEIIQAYYASITLMDAQVGRLLDALERLELAESTIVLFVSDHGYHLGHHGLWQKGDLFEGSARVPLVVRDPRMSGEGRATSALVELVDLYPMLAELTEVAPPDHLSGVSFTQVLEDPERVHRAAALTEAWSRAGNQHPELRGQEILGYSIRTDRYRFTVWGGGEHGVELYDYEEDPGEYINFAEDPEYRETRRALHQMLLEAVRRAGGAG